MTQNIDLPIQGKVTIEIRNESSVSTLGNWNPQKLTIGNNTEVTILVSEEGQVFESVDSEKGILYQSMLDFEQSRMAGMKYLSDESLDSLLFFFFIDKNTVEKLLSDVPTVNHFAIDETYSLALLNDGRVLEYDNHWKRGKLFQSMADFEIFGNTMYGADFIVPIISYPHEGN